MLLPRLTFGIGLLGGLAAGGAALAQCYGPMASGDADLCTLQQFIQMDRNLNDTYQRLLGVVAPERQAAVQQEQQGWSANREKRCVIVSNGHRYVDYSCMTTMDAARLAAVKAEMSAPVVDAGDHGVYAVYGSSMPWLWTENGLNAAYQFGLQDGTGPIVITLKSLRAKAGDTITVKYIAGQFNIGPGFQMADASGTPTDWDDSDRGSQAILPGTYMSPRPKHLSSLVGTFADASGAITGTPFAIGDGPADIIVPQAATQLQLGMDDDVFYDNSGSIAVLVTVKK